MTDTKAETPDTPKASAKKSSGIIVKDNTDAAPVRKIAYEEKVVSVPGRATVTTRYGEKE